MSSPEEDRVLFEASEVEDAVREALDDFKKRFADWLAEQGYAWTANALRDGSWERK